MTRNRSLPILSSVGESKPPPNPLLTTKKSHRVVALMEALHQDSPSLSAASGVNDFPTPAPPDLARSLSENDSAHHLALVSSPVQQNILQWSQDENYDLSKDTLLEFLEEVVALLFRLSFHPPLHSCL